MKQKALLEEPEIAAAIEDFRRRVRGALTTYGGMKDDVEAVLSDAFNLSYLASTARAGGGPLKTRWFSKGAVSGAAPGYHKHIYEASSHGDLVGALAQTPRDGIHLCLIRDPVAQEFSHFCFGVKDGANVYTLSEEVDWAHPLASQMTRKPARHLDSRMEKFSFPYELLDLDGRKPGSNVADPDDDSASAQSFKPRELLFEVNPYSRVWLAMMFERITRDFWGKPGTAELSYCADRIGWDALRAPWALPVLAAEAVPAPVLETVTREAVGASAIGDLWEAPTTFNNWMEERYAEKVAETCIQLPHNARLAIGHSDPSDLRDQEGDDFEAKTGETELGVDRVTGHPVPVGRNFSGVADRARLLPLDPRKVGTLEELQKDARWRGRYNLAVGVNTLAHEEFRNTKGEIAAWFQQRMEANLPALVTAAVTGVLMAPSQTKDTSGFEPYGRETRNIVRRQFKLSTWSPRMVKAYALARRDGPGLRCVETGAKTAVWTWFTPSLPEGLAALAGVPVEQLPAVLQHWKREEDYHGNSILQNLDPMEWVVRNPWIEEKFMVLLCLSKGAFKAACRTAGVPQPENWADVEAVPASAPKYEPPCIIKLGGRRFN